MNQQSIARKPFGDYLVFVDESGDHGLTNLSPDYPVFVLLFVIARKIDYIDQICREVQRFKLSFWGHDEAVLHEHDIRKPSGMFQFLQSRELREDFLGQLTGLIERLPVLLVAIVIDKIAFTKQYVSPVSPYDYALEAGLERVYRHLESVGQAGKETPLIVECRGRKEDAELELAFRRVCDGNNVLEKSFPFNLVMVPKSSNSIGLQLADLIARPIGLHHCAHTSKTEPSKSFRPNFAGVQPEA
jgi:hypothetical protein